MTLLDTNVLIYVADRIRSWGVEILGWPLPTADPDRFRTYFPSVSLQTP